MEKVDTAGQTTLNVNTPLQRFPYLYIPSGSFAFAKLLVDAKVFAVESSVLTFKFASKRLSKMFMASPLGVPLFPSSRQSASAELGTPESQ